MVRCGVLIAVVEVVVLVVVVEVEMDKTEKGCLGDALHTHTRPRKAVVTV